jgi:hypothetical protein
MSISLELPASRPPWWYWAAVVIALLWTLLGVVAWTMDLMMDQAALAEMSPAQQQLYAARPQWVFAVYAVAVFSAFAGAIGLALRKRWVTTLFLLSLAAIVLQFGYILFGMDAIGVLGAGEALPLPIMIFLFGVFLLWFARYSRRHGWI